MMYIYIYIDGTNKQIHKQHTTIQIETNRLKG